jgi:hypothetical protein
MNEGAQARSILLNGAQHAAPLQSMDGGKA